MAEHLLTWLSAVACGSTAADPLMSNAEFPADFGPAKDICRD